MDENGVDDIGEKQYFSNDLDKINSRYLNFINYIRQYIEKMKYLVCLWCAKEVLFIMKNMIMV